MQSTKQALPQQYFVKWSTNSTQEASQLGQVSAVAHSWDHAAELAVRKAICGTGNCGDARPWPQSHVWAMSWSYFRGAPGDRLEEKKKQRRAECRGELPQEMGQEWKSFSLPSPRTSRSRLASSCQEPMSFWWSLLGVDASLLLIPAMTALPSPPHTLLTSFWVLTTWPW